MVEEFRRRLAGTVTRRVMDPRTGVENIGMRWWTRRGKRHGCISPCFDLATVEPQKKGLLFRRMA